MVRRTSNSVKWIECEAPRGRVGTKSHLSLREMQMQIILRTILFDSGIRKVGTFTADQSVGGQQRTDKQQQARQGGGAEAGCLALLRSVGP